LDFVVNGVFHKYLNSKNGMFSLENLGLDAKISILAKSVTEILSSNYIGGHIGFHRKRFVSQVNQ